MPADSPAPSLDAALKLKAHAADYCGTAALREASRESVEAFINDLAERAAKDRDGLLCHLNSYTKSQPEVTSNESAISPDLHREGPQRSTTSLEGAFLVGSIASFYRWHPQRPFYVLRLTILEPKKHQNRSFTGRLYCTPKALWKLRWFLRDFGYDPDLMGKDEVDEKALLGLRGIVRISRTTLNGRCFLNLGGFAPASD